MRFITILALGAVQGYVSAANAFTADIRADTNRDGVVDLIGSTDVDSKQEWTTNRGALFLPNIGDTDRRCSRLITNSTSDEQLAVCNDAFDNVQRSPQYLAPLKTVPLSDISDSATGRIEIREHDVRSLVRIFHRRGGQWDYVTSNTTFSSDDLRAGLDLGIDARDTRRPGVWDGRVTVHFTVKDGEIVSEDKVMLRVAPVLTHHHGQVAQQLVTSTPPLEPGFNEDISAVASDAGISAPTYILAVPPLGDGPDPDGWVQDFFEPGYASMPGPSNATIALRIMIRSPQDKRTSGRLVFTTMRNASVGAVQVLGNPFGTTSAMGNLEAIPPYEHHGKTYPAGRIIIGADLETNSTAFNLAYMQAQETQDPLLLDTAWLAVGHVDEFIQFLPMENERGWVAMVDDPLLGIQMLRNASVEGYGDLLAYSRKNATEDPRPVPGQTIEELLATKDLVSDNEEWGRRIDANLDILKKETGICDEDIFRLPALWYSYESELHIPPFKTERRRANVKKDVHHILPKAIIQISGPFSDDLVARQEEEAWAGKAVSYWPGMINGVVLSDTHVMVPKPWGPVIDGRDIFEEAAREVYAAVGFNVTFVDSWGYHVGGGEIHCGTNMLRDISDPWW